MVQRLRELLLARPFTPFTITMSDGSKREVRHPVHAALAKHFLFVVDADNEEVLHNLYLLHVAHIDSQVSAA